MGRPDGAAACFRRAREIDPDDWTASYLLGVAEDRAGRPAEAVAAYRTALTKNEGVAEAHNNLAWLLADRDFDPVQAQAHARRAAELAPEDPNVLGTLGWAQYKNRLLDEAAVTLKKATKALPDDPMKHYMLGVVQLERGEREDARRAIETALRLDPGFERAAQAGRILTELGG
jgi:Flp pilus assembly protein TadD